MCETINSDINGITHVIFDLDGTLIDTELWGLNNVNTLLSPYGKVCTAPTYSTLLGLDPLERSKRIIEEFELDYDKHKFLNDWYNQCFKTITDIRVMPGAHRLVEHLYSHGIPLAIATVGKKAEFYAKTGHLADLFGEGKYFTHVVHGDDKRVKRLKPFPDLFEVCAKDFSPAPVDPKNVLVFEDNFVGISAATSAGMRTVLVSDNRFVHNKDIKADIIVDGFERFRPECAGLPPFP